MVNSAPPRNTNHHDTQEHDMSTNLQIKSHTSAQALVNAIVGRTATPAPVDDATKGEKQAVRDAIMQKDLIDIGVEEGDTLPHERDTELAEILATLVEIRLESPNLSLPFKRGYQRTMQTYITAARNGQIK